MRYLAAYQTGLWLAEYGDIRCQLCRVYRSTPQRLQSRPAPHTKPSSALMLPNSLRHRLSRALSKGLLCRHCHNSIVWCPTPFAVDITADVTLSIQSASYYDYPMRQAIRAFKHHEDMTKLPLLLHALRQLPRPHGCHQSNSIIVAMPTTNQRLIKRGFDPVSILSAQLSKHWQIPLWHGVRRTDEAVSQQGLNRAERLSNLHNAFTLIETPPVKRILCFDDVSTTGASFQALARTLCAVSETASLGSSPSLQNQHISAYALAHGSQP